MSQHRRGFSKSSFYLMCALKLCDGFRQFAFLFIGLSEELMGQPVIGIEFGRFTQLVDCLVVPARKEVGASQKLISLGRYGVELLPFFRFRDRLVGPGHICRQKPGIEFVWSRIVWIEFDSAFVLSFGCRPIPVVPMGHSSQQKVCVRERIVYRQSFPGRIPGLRHRLFG